MKQHKVTLVFKGGAVVKIKLKDIIVERRGGEITKIKWTNGQGQIVFINVDEVAAVIA